VTFRVTDLNGTPLPGITLSLTLGGRGSLDPTFGTTDVSGTLTTHFVAPPTEGSATLTATVVERGRWGHASVDLAVSGAPPPAWIATGTALLPWVAAGVVAGAVLVLWLRRRRRRSALPSMPLRRYLKERAAEERARSGPDRPAGPPGPPPGQP
jgi:hypothetical protein